MNVDDRAVAKAAKVEEAFDRIIDITRDDLVLGSFDAHIMGSAFVMLGVLALVNGCGMKPSVLCELIAGMARDAEALRGPYVH